MPPETVPVAAESPSTSGATREGQLYIGDAKALAMTYGDFEERTALVADDELTEALDQPVFQIRID